jgi:transposase InsO family protein
MWARFFVTKEANNVVNFLSDIMMKDGAPVRYLTDNGKEFIAKPVRELFAGYNSKEEHGKPYHPQTQGAIERAHAPLKLRLVTILLQSYNGILPKDVEECNSILDSVVHAKNTEMHYTTRCILYMVCLYIF